MLAAWRERILEVPRVDRVERLGDQGVTLKILGTVRAADHLAVAGELRAVDRMALPRQAVGHKTHLGWRAAEAVNQQDADLSAGDLVGVFGGSHRGKVPSDRMAGR